MKRNLLILLTTSAICGLLSPFALADDCFKPMPITDMSAEAFCQKHASGLPDIAHCYVVYNASPDKTLTIGSPTEPQMSLTPGMEGCIIGAGASTHELAAGYYSTSDQYYTVFALSTDQGAVIFNKSANINGKQLTVPSIGTFN